MRYLSKVLITCSLFLVGCSQGLEPAKSAVLSEQMTGKLAKLGHYTRMVTLEAHNEALLGSIDRVVVDPDTGDLLVSDRSVSHRVYRFNSAGKYLRSYGKRGQGPGEYESLMTFTLMGNGEVAVFAQGKRLLFEADGTLLLEREHRDNDLFVERIGSQLYAHSFGGPRARDQVLAVLDENLEEVKRFHPYDRRMDHIKFMPNHGLTTVGDQLVVSEFCDFELSLYEASGKPVTRLGFPSENEELDDLWQVRRNTKHYRKAVDEVIQKLRRARAVHGVGDMVYILEAHQESETLRSLIWDIPTGQTFAYNGLRLIRAGEEAGYLSMSALVGRYEKGLIGYCNEPELFERFKGDYPFAADIEFGDDDNPVLMFFELRDPVSALAAKEVD